MQDIPGFTLCPEQLFAGKVKLLPNGPPLTFTTDKVELELMFVRDTVNCLFVPVHTFPKLNFGGESDTFDTAEPVLDPDKGIVNGAPTAAFPAANTINPPATELLTTVG